MSKLAKEMNQLYPFKFKPIFRDKIWGGEKIKQKFGLNYAPLPNCGEAWLVSGYEGEQSIVSNGFLAENELNELVEVYMEELVGDNVYEKYGNEFPILVKLIDTRDWLSVQVHPDDVLAHKRGLENGKSEMWYILDAEKDARLISGLSKKTSREEFLHHVNEKKLKEILNYEDVKAGDLFHIPAGRVHAIGPSIFLAEIQQTSDTTYRVYDWDRVQADGTFRELHVNEALEAINYNEDGEFHSHYRERKNETTELISEPHFTTNLISLNKGLKKDYSLVDSFVIYTCIEGEYVLEYNDEKIPVVAGEAVLIPASLKKVNIFPAKTVKILETYVV